MSKPTKTTAKINVIKELADNVKHFELIPEEAVSFQAGQFVKLSFEYQEHKYKKSYSIASPPSQETIELCIKLVPHGEVTPKLWEKKEGDEVEIMGGLGLFNANNITKQNIVLIGTGTGIAPLRSILKDQIQHEVEKEFQLIFGARHENHHLYEEEFYEIESNHPNFKYTPVLSQPKTNWLGRVGYVQENLDNIDLHNSHVFICGNPTMVDQVKKKLLLKGMDGKDISVEKY